MRNDECYFQTFDPSLWGVCHLYTIHGHELTPNQIEKVISTDTYKRYMLGECNELIVVDWRTSNQLFYYLEVVVSRNEIINEYNKKYCA